jgi:hypothetical protein
MDIVTRIKIWTGACAAAADNEDIKATLEKSGRVLWLAEQGSDFSKNLRNAAYVFRNARDGLTKVGESLNNVNGLCLDIRALTQIHEAMKVLNQDGIIQSDGAMAAQAFGKLLSGFGRLAKHLPPPANAYASILEACGGDFFSIMRKNLNPEERWKRQFKEIEGF